MAKIVNIAKNASYLTFALIIQKAISFTYFTLLARFVGPEYLGKYYLAISFTSILAIFIDVGLSSVLTREVAKDQVKGRDWLGNIISLKLLLTILVVVAAFVIVKFMHLDELTLHLVYISMICMIFDSFAATFFSFIRGFHNLSYESVSSIVFQLIILILGYGALLAGGGLIWAMGAVALASFYNFLFSALVIRYRLRVSLKALFDRLMIKGILMIAWPFGIYAILQTFYIYLDTVLLSFFSGSYQVGLYQIAFKIVFALQFLPMAFTASLYPALSAYWKANRPRLAPTLIRSFDYLSIISWPIVAGILVLAPKFVLLFKSEYRGAALPLQLSILALFFAFANYPLGACLNACDRQKENTRNMAIVVFSSVVLNLLLIPHWKAAGAALTVLITNALLFWLGLYWVKKVIPQTLRFNWRVLGKSLLASLVMGLFIFSVENHFSVWLLVPAGAVIYTVILWMLKGFNRQDILDIYHSFKKSNTSLDEGVSDNAIIDKKELSLDL